ncbi:hypothetical protein CkaCkLH20_00378 [Colletotrichum karsti]|uniref:Flo11 n=1 Tax=Colletotrichum karsti TaxID=1095194 RepID=A0A9P6IFC1_9PEZI|nr:uncharacterized protein CkaCkLH20_00378 [Colletotrichum karsti]KAF9882342.1 hypothetical protein CkaCkLH20_00378 [Colletotrichum karsti]
MAYTGADSTIASRSPSVIPSPQFQTRSRTQSVSSDRPSTIMSVGLMSPPLSVTPEPAFIAASAASQIVTNDHDSHADTWYDQHGVEPAGETALVSTAALQLVNSFLDQLLFNFLSASRATTLSALRPAVSEVLKPKLAKDAINQADEELREYLGGGDEDDFVQPSGASSSPKDWDLELVWKRTRLRCMVYSSLGDMEEEDEDYYMEQENLKPGVDERGPEIISPAVAIFLTSILEYMGEQALVVAGQAAYHRLRSKFEKEPKQGAKSIADVADRIVVEELDMERVALDRTLGRLWRSWKKRIRSPALDGRPFSRKPSGHFRQNSTADNIPANGLGIQEATKEEPELDRVEEYVKASAVPLPIGDRDIDEIEVPGLASYSDDEASENEEEEPAAQRPKSLMIFTSQPSNDLPTPTMSQPHTPTATSGRKRSNSLPTPSPSPYASPVLKRAKIEPIPTELADQEGDPKSSADKEISTEELPAEAKIVDQKAIKPETVEETEEPSIEVVKETKPEVLADEAPEIKPRNPNRTSQKVASVAASPTTVVAEVATATTVAVAQTKPEPADEDNGDIDDLDEEVEICTSSRVSVAGRSSPSVSESGKAVVVAPMGLKRTPSARVVDVRGPKSPIGGSRTSSVEASDRSQAPNLSRASSVSRSASTPPIVEEKPKPKPVEVDTIIRSSTATPRTRSPVEKLSRRQNTNESISEEEEVQHRSSRQDVARTAATASLESPASTPTPKAGTPEIRASQAIFNPARQQPSPRHQHSQSATKVTILSNTNTSGPFVEERLPSPRSRPHATPTLPDRSGGRTAQGTHSPAASIGVVSVDRTANRDSPERPNHLRASGSSGSSSTGKIRAVRTSEDSKASGRADNLARNFEELIQSDQTIQYTLTPESMRDMDGNRARTASPVVGSKSRRSEDARTAMSGERNRSVSGADIRRTMSVSRATGLNSHPVETKPKGFVPRAPPSTTLTRSRTNGPMARDARVPRDTAMNDFADFIRSTGPTADNGPAPLRNISGPPPVPVKHSLDSRRISSSNNRPRLQARDAAVDNREDNSDLIDFIRRGPPSASNPRIPRTVAPFRTTMDSDQMSGAVGGKAVDASLPDIRYSQASTAVTDITMPSVQSSINSQSALIKNNRPSGNAFDDDDMMPKRTRRRVRDPYAIDLSDEDEEDYAQAVRPPPKKEESLADFLKNYSPPPEPAAPVVPQSIKRKASAPSLIGRFSRKDSNAGLNSAKPPKVDSRSLNSRAGAAHGHVPIQVSGSSGQDKNGAVDATANRPAMHSSAGRVPMKKFEPREAVSSTSRTGDLASFLRNADPPPQAPSARFTPPPEQQQSGSSSGFSKMFGRRKKSSLV